MNDIPLDHRIAGPIDTYEDDHRMLNRIMRDVMPKTVRISPDFPRYTPPDNSPEAKAARVVEFSAVCSASRRG